MELMTYLEFIDHVLDKYDITVHQVRYINWQHEYFLYTIKGNKYFK